MVGVFVAGLIAASCAISVAESKIAGSVVKIYAVTAPWDYMKPWTREASSQVSGSGCIIDGGRILTSAHVIADTQFIQVKRAGKAEKYAARVEVVAHECDLAILKVEDDVFFAGAAAVPLGDLVRPQDKVAVYGFPQGGEEMSVTAGIVSRVEKNDYAHSMVELLCGQIDAAINVGNSGGPVIKDGRLVGVAFQAGKGENISYMVPAPVIRRFLKDSADGTYGGTPGLEIYVQTLENPDLREKLGLRAAAHKGRGIAVREILHGSPADGLLMERDVILAVDGQPVAQDGTVEFRRGERTDYEIVIQEKFLGDSIEVEVFRDGETKKIPIVLNVRKHARRMIEKVEYDRPPTYYLVGGLVFQPLTFNYMALWSKGDAPTRLLYYGIMARKSENLRQAVVLTAILADELNAGYQASEDEIIVEANGHRLKDFSDLVRAVETNTGPYHEFVSDRGFRIVISAKKAEERKRHILETYAVPADRSVDLREEV